MKVRILAILIFAVQIGFGQIYIDSYRFASAAPTNLLLNDYPGAAAAYSLRKLDKDYTGSAIQIRTTGTGTNQPAGSLANIGFDSNGDLDETTIINHCLGTSCTVQTWYDQSGNGHNATAPTANQPTIYTGGAVVVENGKPAILWPNYTTGYYLQNTNLSINYPVSTFSAIYFNGTINRQDYIHDSSNANARAGLLHEASSNKYGLYSGGSNPNGYLLESNADLTATQRIFSTLFNGSNSYIYKNGSITASGGSGIIFHTQMIGVTIGNFILPESKYNWSGKIHELIIYGSNQSTNRTNIESNINSYYSIY